MALSLSIDGKHYSVDAHPTTPLLWVMRDYLNMTGTKYGCGMALCGACTVLQNGVAIRSCVTPVNTLGNTEITTIENEADPDLKKVQRAWIEADVVQCGYCQSGQIMSATSLIKTNPKPSEADIVAAMEGNLCRCGTYGRIKSAMKNVGREA